MRRLALIPRWGTRHTQDFDSIADTCGIKACLSSVGDRLFSRVWASAPRRPFRGGDHQLRRPVGAVIRSGRMTVRLESNGRRLRSLRGPWVDERTDHTGRMHLRVRAWPAIRRKHLVHPRERSYRPDRAGQLQHRPHPRGTHLLGVVRRHLWPGVRHQRGAARTRHLRRHPPHPARPLRALWRHGLRRPRDPASLQEESGQVWRNLVSDGVEKVSETLEKVPGPSPLRAPGPARPDALRRGSDHRPVGRPRDFPRKEGLLDRTFGPRWSSRRATTHP